LSSYRKARKTFLINYTPRAISVRGFSLSLSLSLSLPPPTLSLSLSLYIYVYILLLYCPFLAFLFKTSLLHCFLAAFLPFSCLGMPSKNKKNKKKQFRKTFRTGHYFSLAYDKNFQKAFPMLTAQVKEAELVASGAQNKKKKGSKENPKRKEKKPVLACKKMNPRNARKKQGP